MIITKLVPKSNNSFLISIYVDDVYLADVSIQSVQDNNLRVLKSVTNEEIDNIKQLAQIDFYYQQVLKYLALRQRSVFEIVNYLTKKKIDQDIIEAIVNRLKSQNLVDDAKFAEAFISDRTKLKPSSSLKIIHELKLKGISLEIIQNLMNREEIDNQALSNLIIRKRRISRYQDDKKLMQYLISQGFSYYDVKKHLKTQPDD